MAITDLHSKYRPAAFSDVIGHEAAVLSIQRVIKSQTCRAFIFVGPSGVGKTTLARIVAREVGCSEANLVEIDAATHTGVDAMRDVTDSTQYAPLGGRARVYVIDEAHALSKAAWQSLLKAIEEPPPAVYWCLCTTEGVKVPETIRTRCTLYDLKPIPSAALFDLLQKVDGAERLHTAEDVLYLVAEKSGGSPRRALTYLAQVAGMKSRKDAAGLLRAAGEETEVIDLCRALMKGLSWTEGMRILKGLKDQSAEGIRLTVVGYMTSVLLNTKSDQQAGRLLAILDAFADPYPSGATIYPVILSLGRLLVS